MIKGIGNNPSFVSTMSSKDKIKTDNVEKSKVDRIKDAINNGNYKIDLDKTAEKLAETLL
jgi:anti-sigma28 factor (negative regulator of flagellin synthesis)